MRTKPASCALCRSKTIEPLIFSDYAREQNAKDPSRGYAWFCARHAAEAMKLGSATLPEALKKLDVKRG